jgi:preprotein translocase subunit Sss1
MNIVLPDETRKSLMRIQGLHAKKIDMTRYFHKIDGKTISLDTFEEFLSKAIMVETNRVFELVDKPTEKELVELIKVLRGIITVLRGDFLNGISVFFKNLRSVFRLSTIIRSLDGHLRFLVFVPQLALLDNFSKLLLAKKGNMHGLEPHDFLEAVAKFSIFHSKGQITFMHRTKDTTNNASNKAFGPEGVQCPGNIYTFNFIRSILEFLQSLVITIDGEAIWKGGRFKYISNKNDIKIKFVLPVTNVEHDEDVGFEIDTTN